LVYEQQKPTVIFHSYERYTAFKVRNTPMPTSRFPDDPRGTAAERVGGRCPLYDERLEVGPDFISRLDLQPLNSRLDLSDRFPFMLFIG
jgi:hypothetical protein